MGYSPWGRKESDTTERLHFHFSLSCIGEGNGNPLQCSCLENPRDGGAWWAAVYGVAQSRTRLKRLSSSSSSSNRNNSNSGYNAHDGLSTGVGVGLAFVGCRNLNSDSILTKGLVLSVDSESYVLGNIVFHEVNNLLANDFAIFEDVEGYDVFFFNFLAEVLTKIEVVHAKVEVYSEFGFYDLIAVEAEFNLEVLASNSMDVVTFEIFEVGVVAEVYALLASCNTNFCSAVSPVLWWCFTF